MTATMLNSLWIAIDNRDGRRLLASSSSSGCALSWMEFASQPCIFPREGRPELISSLSLHSSDAPKLRSERGLSHWLGILRRGGRPSGLEALFVVRQANQMRARWDPASKDRHIGMNCDDFDPLENPIARRLAKGPLQPRGK